MFCNSTAELIEIMGNTQQYKNIQVQIKAALDAAKKTHPLYPTFSASHNAILDKLVSTPETKDAFELYPKTIKGTYKLDFRKYPDMDKSETPWDYAYRTQTNVELETTSYKEYLGDTEDPFPITEYSNGMITVISPPEFPPAVDAAIISGNVRIPLSLRRKPCQTYGQMIFGSVSDDNGLGIKITAYKDAKKTDFSLTKNFSCSLELQLQREKLVCEIKKTKKMSIVVGSAELLNATLTEEQLNCDLFLSAPYFVHFLEALIFIENHEGCHFDLNHDISEEEYKAALILASSLRGEWYKTKTDFDDEIRCDCDRISDDALIEDGNPADIVIEGTSCSISLLGKSFSANKYFIVFQNARINNRESVIKNRKRRKKNIMITFRPAKGMDYFFKSYRFEDIRLLSENEPS